MEDAVVDVATCIFRPVYASTPDKRRPVAMLSPFAMALSREDALARLAELADMERRA